VAQSQGLRLKVLETVEQLSKELDQIIGSVLKEAYQLERRKAAVALETIHAKIGDFISNNITFETGDFYMMNRKAGGDILRIDKLEVGNIKNVITTSIKDLLLKTKKGEKVPISFDVQIKLYVDVLKKPSTAPLFPTSVKVGEPVPTPMYRALIEVFNKEKFEPTDTTETLDLDVLVEASAEIINDEYTNIEPISVKPRRVI
jgi:transcriptional regulator CtsR